jgi:quinoprotein glucose dehydrogenase
MTICSRRPAAAALVLSAVVVCCADLVLSGQAGAPKGEWQYYAADAGSTNYSPLSQIDRNNVKDLRVAWRWKSENFGPRPDTNYEVTPLMVGGVLYATAGSRRDVVAIDAVTGETLWMWRLDEGPRASKSPIRPAAGRGVAYWSDGTRARILHVTPGYRLVALDAKTGQAVRDFGKEGMVDLYEGLDRPVPADGQIGLNSPPLVVGNIVVVGAALQTLAPTMEFAPGFVRGYDVRTGKRVWIFHTIPTPGETGNDTWERDSWSYTGNTGVWAPMSADLELGYIYLPVETPTNDNYGGHRLGSNLFAESLVCLDAKTGERVWHFQLVHHGLWDYDIPAAPILVDVTVGGKKIKAVAQLTKQAFTFVFDRVTGKPIWPIEERPVPQSDVPGERTSPTQPFPTKPAPFDRQGMTADDLVDFTPEIKAEALRIASQYRMGPLFTPPSLVVPNGTKGTWFLPAGPGGANWPGGAVDPETGVLYVPSVTSASANALAADPQRSTMSYLGGWVGGFGGGGRVPGRGNVPEGDQGPHGLPMVKPPWGRITAIDLNTGDHLWMVPNGDTPEYVKKHLASAGVTIPKTGQPGRAGVMVTKTLLFAGEGNGLFASPPGGGGPMLRAYDKATGAVVGEFKLPANQSGVPMTYMVNGKQFIVVAVGARNQAGELVALALP